MSPSSLRVMSRSLHRALASVRLVTRSGDLPSATTEAREPRAPQRCEAIMFALVCCFSLIGTLPQAEIQGSESEVTFTITSEAHPVLSDAVAESHGELHKLAWQWLSDNSSNLPPQGRESLPSWLQTASSRRTESSEAIDTVCPFLFHETV